MKFLIFFILLPIGAFALDRTPDNTRNIKDLMYQPLKGTFFWMSGIGVGNDEIEYTYLGTKLADIEREYTAINNTVGYSFTDNFLFGVKLSYVLDDKTSTKYGAASILDGTTITTKNEGRTDPTLGFSYRAFSQKERNLNADVTFSFTPKTGDSETGSADKKGNEFNGGHVFEAQIQLGKKLKDISFMGEFSIGHHFDSESKDLSNDTKIKQDSRTDIGIGGKLQFVFIEKSYINGGFALIKNGDSKLKYADGTSATIEYDMAFIVTLGLGYEIVKDSFLVTIDLVSKALDQEQKNSDGTSYQGEREIGELSLGAIIQF